MTRRSLISTRVRFLLPLVSTMDAKSQRSKRRDSALSSLNAVIEAMNLAKEALCVPEFG
jgi:hypothetical protein